MYRIQLAEMRIRLQKIALDLERVEVQSIEAAMVDVPDPVINALENLTRDIVHAHRESKKARA